MLPNNYKKQSDKINQDQNKFSTKKRKKNK